MLAAIAISCATLASLGVHQAFASLDTGYFTVGVYNNFYHTKCSSSYYYDSMSLKCTSCPDNYIPDTTITDGWGNYIQCTCDAGYYKVYNDCQTDEDSSGDCLGFTCAACNSNTASYSDRSSCATCDTTTTNGVSDEICDCKSGYDVIVETDNVGDYLSPIICATCPTGTKVITSSKFIAGQWYYASNYECQSCPDKNMLMDSSFACTCNSGYIAFGVAQVGPLECVQSSVSSEFSSDNAATDVKYYGAATQTLSSITFEHYYVKSAVRCKYYSGPEDMEYCQALANLCVLQLYNDQSSACSTFLDIMDERSGDVNNIINWQTSLPWLYFTDNADEICTFDFSARPSFSGFYMQLMVGVFHTNGTFVGYQDVDTLFAYCGMNSPETSLGGGTSTTTFWQKFGWTQTDEYDCALNSLLSKDQYFYELNLYDRREKDFFPVPVRITNLKSGASEATPNNEVPDLLCNTGDVLVRRFFLYDIVSGITGASSYDTSTPSVVRYAKTIQLETSIIGNYMVGMYPSVLTIEYEEVSTSGWTDGTTDTYTVVYNYTMPMDSFSVTLKAFFIAFVVFVGVFFLHRYLNWNKRNFRLLPGGVPVGADIGTINVSVFTQVSLILLHSWVLFFFPFTLLICWYFFVFFKVQKVPSVMLPPMGNYYSPQSEYYIFTCSLHALAIFQFIWVVGMTYRQCNADICFIDWEPTKIKEGSPSKVSVWRTVLAANEWAEMQVKRKIDVKFSLFWIAFFLIGLNLQYNATQQPSLQTLQPGTQNIVLRFANTTWWWLLLSFVQWSWKYFIYERYLGEPPAQVFIDFCTIAKVSLLVLDEKYHGYYLHCRSPHQYADGSMAELVEMLHKEEAGLTVDRSLDGAPADVQSFEVFLTGEWRIAFDKIYSVIHTNPSINDVIHQGRVGRNRRQMGGSLTKSSVDMNTSLPPERALKAWKELSIFLQEFIDNNFGRTGLRRIVREATYWEKVSFSPPDITAPDQPCVFFPDRNFEYSKMLFLGKFHRSHSATQLLTHLLIAAGNELDLTLMNILSYSLFDLWFNNTMVSVLLTYLLDYLLTYVREAWGRSVLSRKTLVDERFLF